MVGNFTKLVYHWPWVLSEFHSFLLLQTRGDFGMDTKISEPMIVFYGATEFWYSTTKPFHIQATLLHLSSSSLFSSEKGEKREARKEKRILITRGKKLDYIEERQREKRRKNNFHTFPHPRNISRPLKQPTPPIPSPRLSNNRNQNKYPSSYLPTPRHQPKSRPYARASKF